jgi:hypothetical protein
MPVLSGDTIELDANNPSFGFNPCNTIYNFYPVNKAGLFNPTGEFTLIRRTEKSLAGYTLAPRGKV